MTKEIPQTVGASTLSDGLDGIIELDTERALCLGFTSDKYGGYLWKTGDSVIISFIVSKQPGNFKSLVDKIHGLGLTVKVPTPLGRMKVIVKKNRYKLMPVFDKQMGETVEVWELPPTVGAPTLSED